MSEDTKIDSLEDDDLGLLDLSEQGPITRRRLEIMEMGHNPIAKEALHALELGLQPVFLQWGTKDGFSGPWQHLQTKRQTRESIIASCGDPDQPNAYVRNWGIVTGAISGLVDVECDDGPGNDWCESRLPPTPMIWRSGSGSIHRGYRHPGGIRIPNAVHMSTFDGRSYDPAADSFKIDRRADGGYAVMPGSMHPSGKEYEWINRPDSIEDMSALPVYSVSWFPDDPKKKRGKGVKDLPPSTVVMKIADLSSNDIKDLKGKIKSYIDKVPGLPEGGGRDDRAYYLAGKLARGFNLPPNLAMQYLKLWDSRNSPPLGDGILQIKLNNAIQYGIEPFGSMLEKFKPKPATASTPGKGHQEEVDEAELAAAFGMELVAQRVIIDRAPPRVSEANARDWERQIRQYDPDTGHYALMSLDTIMDDYAVRRESAGLGYNEIEAGKVIKALVRTLAVKTWKEEHRQQSSDLIAFNNGFIVSRAAYLRGNPEVARPWDPEFYVTYYLNVPWSPKADTRPIIEHILPIFQAPGIADDLAFEMMQEYFRFVRSVLFGDTSHKRCLYMRGQPGTGKSTLAECLQWLVPPHFRTAFRLEDFGCSTRKNPEYTIASIEHSLLNVGPEIRNPDGTALETFKAIVTGDEVSGRHAHGRNRTYRPRTNFLWTSQNKLKTCGVDLGSLTDRFKVLLLERRIRGTDKENEHWARDFMSAHAASFVAYAIGVKGMFGKSPIYLETAKEGIEGNTLNLFIRGELGPGQVVVRDAVELFSRTYYKITPQVLSDALRDEGFERRGDKWATLPGGKRCRSAVYAPPSGYYDHVGTVWDPEDIVPDRMTQEELDRLMKSRPVNPQVDKLLTADGCTEEEW